MKFFLHTIAFASLSVVAASLQAQAVTINAGTRFEVNDPTSTQRAYASFVGGYGALDFSAGDNYDGVSLRNFAGSVSALNLISGGASTPAPQGILGASVVTHTLNHRLGPVIDAISWQSPAVDTLTVQSAGVNAGEMLDLGLKGGLRMSSRSLDGTATGGVIEMSNIHVDLENGRIVADLSGTRYAIDTPDSIYYQPAESFSSLATAVWTFNSVNGPTRINPASLAGADPIGALKSDGFTVYTEDVVTYVPSTCSLYTGNGYFTYPCDKAVTRPTLLALRSDLTLNDLMLTSEANTFLSDAWGLESVGLSALDFVNAKPEGWGDMRLGAFFLSGFNTKLPASIPEPSTYMLMGLGLLGVWAVSRQSARRHQST